MIRRKRGIQQFIISIVILLSVMSHAQAQNNIAPTANDDAIATPQKTRVLIPVLTNDTDPNGDALSIVEATAPAHGTLALYRRSIYYTPYAGFVGQDSFTYTISDGHGGFDSADVTVTVENIPPTAYSDRFNIFQGTTATLAPLNNDRDKGGDTTFTIISIGSPKRGTVSISDDGQTIHYTPAIGWRGNDRFEYIIADPHGGHSRRAFINVQVLNSPPIAADDYVSLLQAESIVITPLDNDTDLNGDTIQLVNVTQAPQNGSFKVIMGRYIRYTPKPAFIGVDELTYSIKDSKNQVATAKIIITVAPKAPTPRDDSATTRQNTPILLDVLRNDTFYNGSSLTITNVTAPNHGTAIISDDGLYIHFTPDDGFAGEVQFDYTVTDILGAQGTARVVITVRNKPPKAANDLFYTVQNSPVTIDVLDNDEDAIGDTLRVLAIDRARNGHAVLHDDGRITFTPDTSFVGQADFFYTIVDAHGRTSSARAIIMVENIAPVAQDDIAETGVNIPVKIEPTLNDSDRGGDNLRIANIRNAHGGTVVIETGRKVVTFTPNGGFAGEATFEYILVDGKGGRDIGRVTVQVVNDAPTAADDKAITLQAQGVYINLVRNDSDVNGHDLFIHSVEQAAHGTVSIHRGRRSVLYTPFSGFAGTDTFTYVVEDGYGGMATATVTVEVTNIPPSAQPDKALTTQLNTVTIDVLANDYDAGGDEDLVVVAVSVPKRGQAEITDDSLAVDYTPDSHWRGRDSFLYTIQDEHGDISTARVLVTVVNSAPTAADDYVNLPYGYSILIHVLHNDHDIDGDPIYLYGITRYPTHGKLRIVGDKIRYIPNKGYSGQDSFAYMIADSQGLTDIANVYITIPTPPSEEPPTDEPPSEEPPADNPNDDNDYPVDDDNGDDDDNQKDPPRDNDDDPPPPPAPVCTDPNPDRDLRNSNTGLHRPASHPTVNGVITNTSDACEYEVGIASYRMFSWNTNTQEYIGSQTAIIKPGETLHFSAAAVECATQVDLFYGPVIYSFAGGVRYGSRLLDATIPNWQTMCPSEETTSTAQEQPQSEPKNTPPPQPEETPAPPSTCPAEGEQPCDDGETTSEPLNIEETTATDDTTTEEPPQETPSDEPPQETPNDDPPQEESEGEEGTSETPLNP